jgi:hypothetical protein
MTAYAGSIHVTFEIEELQTGKYSFFPSFPTFLLGRSPFPPNPSEPFRREETRN